MLVSLKADFWSFACSRAAKTDNKTTTAHIKILCHLLNTFYHYFVIYNDTSPLTHSMFFSSQISIQNTQTKQFTVGIRAELTLYPVYQGMHTQRAS